MTRQIRLPDDAAVQDVRTPDVDRISDVLDFLVDAREIGAVLGGAGLGKTFATDLAARSTGIDVVTLDMPTRPAPKEVTVRMLKAVRGFVDTAETQYELTEQIVEELADGPRVIVIDEAQNLTSEGLNQIRYLHDRPDADWALVLVGGQDAARTLHSQKQLESRVARWVEVAPLKGDMLISSLRSYHELFQFASTDLLFSIDKAFAHGTWREWARFLQAALRLRQRSGYEVLDTRFARAVIHEVNKRQQVSR